MRPEDIACRNCASQPGEPCVWSQVLDSTHGPPQLYHAERMEDADNWRDGSGDAVSKQAFDAAVDATGLV